MTAVALPFMVFDCPELAAPIMIVRGNVYIRREWIAKFGRIWRDDTGRIHTDGFRFDTPDGRWST